MKTPRVKSIGRSPLRLGFLLILLTLACFVLPPTARAVCQEGCLTNGNTVLGDDALFSNTGGSNNTATGLGALASNTTGSDNTASGLDALIFNTTGNNNTATGAFALFFNTTGDHNTASGLNALYNNSTGDSNTAIGEQALSGNTTGSNNTATGGGALASNTTGSDNTASGDAALQRNTTGSNNIALGSFAGFNLMSGDNNIDIGNAGVLPEESGTVRIGTAGRQTVVFIAGIRGVAITGAQAVGVNANGQLGTRASSVRFKEAIKPMDKASEAILDLKPVTFRYKKELDPKGASQFGLVAEEVAKVNPDLVVTDEQGKPFTVRYEEVNAMLLNEFLKEHRTVQEQGAAITRQRKEFESAIEQQQKQIEALTATVKEQAAQIQKVSDQLEASKPSPQVVNNP